MTVLITVDCGLAGYYRELWIHQWRAMILHFFNEKTTYDWNGSKVTWGFHNDEVGKTMSSIWGLKDQGYRTSYQKHVKTFFWVDDKYYKENKKEILSWAERNKCKVPSTEYGWIEMPDGGTELLFRLTWAGKSCG